jgi:hypothetical protein
MLCSVRFNDDVVQQFKDDGQLNELYVSHQPWPLLRHIKVQSIIFFTIIPQKLIFKDETKFSVIFPKEGTPSYINQSELEINAFFKRFKCSEPIYQLIICLWFQSPYIIVEISYWSG